MLGDAPAPVAWLLLRHGHAVPITSLSRRGLSEAVPGIHKRGVELGRDPLGAIVDSLGFDGDFGTYQDKHWRALIDLRRRRGLAEYRNLFEVGTNDLMFGLIKTKRRALADRIFLGPKPPPRRVFLGFGHDWQSWDKNFGASAPDWRADDDTFAPRDMEETRRWVYRHRHELQGVHNFFGDQLLDLGEPGTFDAEFYFAKTGNPGGQERAWTRMRKVMAALRWFIDRREDGWIEIVAVPDTDSLVLLKGPNNSYDMLWRNLREGPPPALDPNAPEPLLHPHDTPSCLQEEVGFATWNYYRRDTWEEMERHQAEKHYYAGGGEAGERYPGMDAVLERYLRDKSIYGEKPKLPRGRAAPLGFVRVNKIDGRSLFISDMITVREYRRFADETEYLKRRNGDDESWSAANDDDKDAAPVGVTYPDALAFCAWRESKLRVAVRLLTLEEHRTLRPFASEHYERLALQDFPWEDFPPRHGLEASVVWSEPRFLDPGPDLPEFPDAHGGSRKSRKRWIAVESWPPRAVWRDPIAWVEHAGLRFIDAWDAYEWCAPGRIAGRYWEGPIGLRSWGEYKNAKVGFRLVVETERANG